MIFNNIQSKLFKIMNLRQMKFGEYKTVFNLFSAYEICSIRIQAIQGKLFLFTFTVRMMKSRTVKWSVHFARTGCETSL
jgi:hypothetical protein